MEEQQESGGEQQESVYLPQIRNCPGFNREDTCSINEAIAYLGKGRLAVLKMLAGKDPCAKDGKAILFFKKDVEDVMVVEDPEEGDLETTLRLALQLANSEKQSNVELLEKVSALEGTIKTYEQSLSSMNTKQGECNIEGACKILGYNLNKTRALLMKKGVTEKRKEESGKFIYSVVDIYQVKVEEQTRYFRLQLQERDSTIERLETLVRGSRRDQEEIIERISSEYEGRILALTVKLAGQKSLVQEKTDGVTKENTELWGIDQVAECLSYSVIYTRKILKDNTTPIADHEGRKNLYDPAVITDLRKKLMGEKGNADEDKDLGDENLVAEFSSEKYEENGRSYLALSALYRSALATTIQLEEKVSELEKTLRKLRKREEKEGHSETEDQAHLEVLRNSANTFVSSKRSQKALYHLVMATTVVYGGGKEPPVNTPDDYIRKAVNANMLGLEEFGEMVKTYMQREEVVVSVKFQKVLDMLANS